MSTSCRRWALVPFQKRLRRFSGGKGVEGGLSAHTSGIRRRLRTRTASRPWHAAGASHSTFLGTAMAGALVLLVGMAAAGAARAAEGTDPLLDRAWWIWWDKDTNAIQPPYKESEFSFTKEVAVEGEVRAATLRITAEGAYQLLINDKPVGADENWQTLETYDIKPFLVAGKNRLLVKARTKGWYGGVFVAGSVELANGTTVPILSDASWDCSSDVDRKVAKAEPVVRGLNGGWWNNCNRLMEMPDRWNRLNTELVAPGIAWAKPWAGAKVKVLAIQPRVTQRDTIELMQRTDMDIRVVFSDFPDYSSERAPFFPETRGWRKSDVAAALAKALEEAPDVLLLGPVEESVFYEVVAERVKTLVEGGMGLIYTTLPARKVAKPGEKPTADPAYEKELTATPIAERPPLLVTGIPFASLPGFRLTPQDKARDFGKVAALYQFGRGRVMRLGLAEGWGAWANARDPNDLHYEYYQSFAIKSILWAAGKEPAIALKDFPAEVTVDLAAGPGELAFGLAGASGACEVTLAIRSPEKLCLLPSAPVARPGVQQGETLLRPVYEAKASATAGEAVKLKLPPLPAGSYFVDVEVTEGGKKAAWGTASLKVTSKLDLASLALDPPWLDLADGKSAKLKAAATLTAPAPAGAAVTFALVDNYDRVLATTTVKVPEGAAKAEAIFPVKAFATTLGKVRAALTVGTDASAVAVARFTTVRRDWDRFFFFGWAATPTDHAGNLYARVLASLGFDAGRGLKVSFDTLEAFDTVALPGYSGMPRNAFDITPENLKTTQEMTQKLVEQTPFDPVAYFCGDEIDYGGGDELPGRIAEYRKFLQARYGKIDALDKQWSATYASFDEIFPITAKPQLSEAEKGKLIPEKEYLEQAKAAGNFSRWMDQWQSNYKAFNDMARVPRKVIREFDPHARVGVDCPMWPFARCGHDWYTFLKEFEMFAPYGKEGEVVPMEEARSFAKPGQFLGLEYGGYLYNASVRREELTDLEWQHWRVWSGLLRGFTSTWWYQLTPPGNESSISPGLLPYPTLDVYARDLATIRSGYYTLYRGARRDYGKIALHYSVPSRLLCSQEPDFGYERCFNEHFLVRLLQDYAGYPYTCVADEQIIAGGLKDYSVLMMPTSYAIGEAEAAALRKFVRGGGLLIADVRPGLGDSSGRIGASETTRSLFGLSWKKELGRKMVTAELSGEYKGVALRNKPQKFAVDPAVELKGAKAVLQVEGVPLVTFNDVGRGTAVCLNVPFNYYRGYPTPDSLYQYLGDDEYHGMLARVLAAIFKAHKVERPVEVGVPGGEWLAGLDTPVHVDGKAEYISFTKRRVAKDETAATVSFRSHRPGYCYDMLEGKYLGQGPEWQVQVAPGGVRLLSVLPYQVKELRAKTKSGQARRGEEVQGEVRVETSGGWPGRHVIGLEVKRPDGQAARYLARSLEAKSGRASFVLPLALNEPPGRYTLTFTDIATHATAELALEVLP